MTPNVLLQMSLCNLGLYGGKPDGMLGPLTLQGLAQAAVGHAVPPDTGAALATVTNDMTPRQLIAFVCNCGVESGFQLTRENMNYTAQRVGQVWPNRFPTALACSAVSRDPQALADAVYGGRMGNCRPGDGFKYRGGGWPQLTGRAAYAAIGHEADPEWVVASAQNSAQASRAFWDAKHLGPLAEAGQFRAVRCAWNGGTNGMDAYLAQVAHLRQLWGL